MWRSSRRGRDEVTCIACGDSVARSEAREYDKFGDRWERSGKEFEHLCKPCDRERCHQPRGELEALLEDVEAAADGRDRETFLATYLELAERADSVEER
ncbi:DUF7562 family protein [Halosimplex pelagicum]|uniref:Small CPxCG-related zinc finger protein n=1 Tax=Halosimplex pelagicum TaxID=869886 RepID=A0A7D5TAL9_9EURY|nr:hypothetical protein [Halosimplex pelagicum]QLH81613.1 hypothetical protein HZS54_08230 [Halosimplex pelagicum]